MEKSTLIFSSWHMSVQAPVTLLMCSHSNLPNTFLLISGVKYKDVITNVNFTDLMLHAEADLNLENESLTVIEAWSVLDPTFYLQTPEHHYHLFNARMCLARKQVLTTRTLCPSKIKCTVTLSLTNLI